MRRKLIGFKGLGRRQKKGVAAIEFVMLFVTFWAMCVCFVEMSYMSYVSALGDVMITEASHKAKLDQEGGFAKVFDDVLKQQDSIWASAVSGDGFKTSIRYVKSYTDLKNVADTCNGICGDPNSPIAIYHISYDYKPIFAGFFQNTGDIYAREMIVIQEYQREGV